jgi:hypothetical protein
MLKFVWRFSGAALADVAKDRAETAMVRIPVVFIVVDCSCFGRRDNKGKKIWVDEA